MRFQVNKRVLYTLLSATVIILGTLIAIEYAKGNIRLGTNGFVQGTGLLAANSFPTGAQVYIDDRLVTATDDTLYLEPGEYFVEIKKDGYTSWSKQIDIEKELVVQTNASLFPVAPSLTTLTFTGAENIAPSPDGQKVLYYTASQSAQRKNGFYILEMSDSPLSLQRGTRQIAEDVPTLDFESAEIIWSPDSSEVLVITETKEFLMDISKMNDPRSLSDVSFQRKQILSEWEEEMYLRERQFLSQFPEEVVAIATQSAKNIYISPDKKRLLYTATEAVTIPDTIIPPLPARNSQPEERALQPGSIYVYDREEDLNFKVATEPESSDLIGKRLLANDVFADQPLSLDSSPSAFVSLQATASAETASNFKKYHTSLYTNTLQWFPDSKHLLFVQDNAVRIVEYDATNAVTLYSGPFDKQFLYPWPDGSRVVIKTSFSPDVPANLYAIELK